MSEFTCSPDLTQDLESSNITPDFSTLTISEKPCLYPEFGDSRVVTFDDSARLVTVGITQANMAYHSRHWADAPLPTPTRLHAMREKYSYSYRGLLPTQRGVYRAVINNDGSVSPSDAELVKVEIVPTPQALNALQKRFGRTPGVDALEFTRIPGGHFADSIYLESFANMQVPTADLNHWQVARHDLEPGVHINSFIETSSWGCSMIADSGKRLVAQYGDSIHLPEDEMPDQVRQDLKRYGTGLEYLRNLNNPIHETLVWLGDLAANDSVDDVVSKSKINEAVRQRFPQGESKSFRWMFWSGWFFDPLGMTPAGTSSDSHEKNFSLLMSDRIGSIGSVLLELENIRQPEGDTEEKVEARKRVWQTAANMGGRLALSSAL
jgi:hypothetical protein